MTFRSKEAEEKVSQLNIDIAELKTQCNIKDNIITTEREKRLRLEQDLQRQNILLERTQRELTSQTSKSAILRAEGRKARKEMSSAAEYLRQVTGVLQMSLSHSTDLNNRIGDDSSQLNIANDIAIDQFNTQYQIISKPTDDKDADPLGIKEISNVLSTIRNLSEFVQDIPKKQMSLESDLRGLELENNRLQRELDGIDSRYLNKLQRLENENKVLEEQIRNLKNREIIKVDESRTIAQLQHENTLLRAKCDRADKKEKELLLEMSSYTERLEGTNNINEIQNTNTNTTQVSLF